MLTMRSSMKIKAEMRSKSMMVNSEIDDGSVDGSRSMLRSMMKMESEAVWVGSGIGLWKRTAGTSKCT